MVITSVDRDDLRDGGAGHFVECIRKTRELSQYLAPSGYRLPVRRYVHPDTFTMFEREAQAVTLSPKSVLHS